MVIKIVKLSIIIPVYNVEKYLKKCLDSVVKQTLEDIEIICVDDCSSDNSFNILKEYAEKDSRFKIMRNEKNKGQGFSRNRGIEVSTGEYITFIDSDDILNLNFSKKTYFKAKNLNLDLLIFKIQAIDYVSEEKTDVNMNYLSLTCFNEFNKLIFNHNDTKNFTCYISVCPCAKIYKRKFIVDNGILFPEDIIFEDEVFFYRCYLRAQRISLLDEFLYYYRVNRPNSTTDRKDQKFMDVVDAFQMIRNEFIETNNLDNEYKKLLYNKFFYSIFSRFNQTDEKFKEEFYLRIKNDFNRFLKTQNDLNLLNEGYKNKALNILSSENYLQFSDFERTGNLMNNPMESMPLYKISIIIPVYNMENYLDKALKSIINQTFGFENIEVIFVDDCSTDKSKVILSNYSQKYENVKSVFLEDNSGFAGKPRNVGLKYASSEFVMFLDPDDYYFNDACEILYNKIINENVDLVSGNYVDAKFNNEEMYDWNKNYGLKGDELKINSIKENNVLMNINPSVWAKIFRKEFLIKNNIIFPEKLPGQDLFFVQHALLKANGIIFLNKSIVYYIARDSENNSSVTCKNNKKVLLGLIKLYSLLYDLFEKNYKECLWFSLKPLYYWITKFIKHDLLPNEIDEVINKSSILFRKFNLDDNLNIPEDKFLLFKAIANQEYDIVKRELANFNNNDISNMVKKKHIFFLCYALEPQIGGLAKSVLNRTKKLAELGYEITILTVDFGQNYESITKILNEKGFLHKNVNILNLFDYYKKKFSTNKPSDYIKNFNDLKDENLNIQIKEDNSIEVEYYNNDIKVKTETYFNNILAIERTFENNVCINEKSYTDNGFCFYEKITKYNREFYCLNNPTGKTLYISAAHEYNKQLHLQTFFIEDICKSYDDKPYLIIESTGHIPSIGNVDPTFAYKIGQLHGNTYREPYTVGSELISFSAINDRDKLEKVVTLTNAQKEDLTKDLEYPNFVTIPNFVENIKLQNVKKDVNKISFVSSISFHKNLFDLIKAFKIVLETKKDAKLEIYGRAYLQWEIDELNKIKKFMKKYNMESNIHFKGYTDNIYDEMKNSLCTVFSSHSEGLSMAMLESIANGTPIIAYDFNYGPKDLIDNGINGIIVEKNNIQSLAKYIIYLLDNPDIAIKMGEQAKIKSEEFLDINVIPKWETLFKETLLDYEIKKPYTKLSVIIPVYNSEKYLSKCLDSVLNQNLKDIEVICIDDCSEDNSLDILLKYASIDERIKIVSLKENHKQGFARNIGIEMAKGEFISFIDSDDWIDLNTFDECYKHAETYDLDMVIFKLINYEDESDKYFETNYYNINFLNNMDTIFNQNIISDKLFSIPLGPVNKIYRSSLLKNFKIRFPDKYKMFEDNPFYYEAFLNSKNVSFIPKHFYYRRIHNNSTMQSTNKNLFDVINISNENIDVFKRMGLSNQYATQLANIKVNSILNYFINSNENIKPEFYKIIKHDFEENIYISNVNILSLLNDENIKFYTSIINCNTYSEFKLMRQIEKINEENINLKNKNNAQIEEIRKMQDSLNEINNTNINLKNKNNAQIEEIRKMQDSLNEINNTNINLKNKNDTQIEEIRKMQDSLNEINNTNINLKNKIGEDKRIIEDLSNKNKKIKIENSKFKNENRSQIIKIKKLENELRKSKKMYSEVTNSKSWKFTKIFRI